MVQARTRSSATTVRPRANELTANRWTCASPSAAATGAVVRRQPPDEALGGGVTAAPMRTKIGSQARPPPAPRASRNPVGAEPGGVLCPRDGRCGERGRRSPSPPPEQGPAHHRAAQRRQGQHGDAGGGIGTERRLDDLEGQGPPQAEHQRRSRLEQREGEDRRRPARGLGPYERSDDLPPEPTPPRPLQPRGVLPDWIDPRQGVRDGQRHQRDPAAQADPGPGDPAPPAWVEPGERAQPLPAGMPRPRRPENDPQSEGPEQRGDHQRGEDQGGQQPLPPEPPAHHDPSQPDPQHQRPERHDHGQCQTVPEAGPEERVEHRQRGREERHPDGPGWPPVENRGRHQRQGRDEHDQSQERPDPSPQPTEEPHAEVPRRRHPNPIEPIRPQDML